MSAYTDADVQAVQDEFDHWLHRMHGVTSSCDHRPEALGILTIVAPAIAARALREAASTLRKIADHGADGEATPYETADWLCIRADEIERP